MREAIEASSVLQIDDENPDIVIAIGGDGTLMSAFHKYFDQIDHIGFVGIHTGQLGFYTWHELTIEEIIETLSQDKIPMTADPLVQATVTLENGEETVLTGLNEITFRRSIQTIEADVYLNKQLFERFNRGGLCVSTPTGSTAYNKALGRLLKGAFSWLIKLGIKKDAEFADLANQVANKYEDVPENNKDKLKILFLIKAL